MSNQVEDPLEAEVGTDLWSSAVRKEVKSLSKYLDESYMELAKLLYTIWDTPVDGDPINAPIFTRWGYSNFGDYVEQELSMHRKKAQRLKSVWYNLEIRLVDSLDPILKKRIVSLGFSKVRELVTVLSARNAEKWVELAEELSYPKMCMAVRKYKEDQREYQASQVEEADNSEQSDEESVQGESLAGSTASGTREFVGSGEELDFTETAKAAEPYEPPVPDYVSEDMVQESFAFYKEQYEVVSQALKTAKSLSNSSVKSNNMHLVCLDFLATNGDGKTSKQQKLKRLVSLADSFGFDLVVVDEGDVAFGIDTLEKLAGS